MKQFFIILFISFLPCLSGAQQYDTTYNTLYYQQRVSLFELMPDTPDEIIMLGNSITNGVSWSEIFEDWRIKNRGIGGDNTFGVLARMDEIVASKPNKIFILIGINDIANGIPVDVIISNYEKIINIIQQKSPETRIYLQSTFPFNNDFDRYKRLIGKEETALTLNTEIFMLAQKYNLIFIDLYPLLLDENGKLAEQYTNDGLHLLGKAYLIWADVLRPFISDIVETAP